jgi:hypothetical protein
LRNDMMMLRADALDDANTQVVRAHPTLLIT